MHKFWREYEARVIEKSWRNLQSGMHVKPTGQKKPEYMALVTTMYPGNSFSVTFFLLHFLQFHYPTRVIDIRFLVILHSSLMIIIEEKIE